MITKKPIRRDGKIIGYSLYSSKKGILGAPKFVGYRWKNK